MTVVEAREQLITPTPEPEAQAPAPDAPTRSCASCGAPLLSDQDWCLECGAAAPGRLGRTRGVRGAAAVAAATVLLAAGAGVTTFAALQDGAARDAAAPGAVLGAATPGEVAAVAPSYLPGKTNPASPTPDPGTALPSLPSVPSTDLAPNAITPTPVVPVAPVTPTPTPAPTATTPQATTGTTTTPTTATTPDQVGQDDSSPQDVTLVPLSLDPTTPASAYDPYGNGAAANDPSRAVDGDDATSWTLPTTDEDPQVGLLVTLPADKRVRGVSFTTSTPGFRAELYTADGSQLPPQITDTRWTHPGDVRSADRGTTTVRFARRGQVARRVVIWITRPAAQGSTVSIDDVKLLGAK